MPYVTMAARNQNKHFIFVFPYQLWNEIYITYAVYADIDMTELRVYFSLSTWIDLFGDTHIQRSFVLIAMNMQSGHQIINKEKLL